MPPPSLEMGSGQVLPAFLLCSTLLVIKMYVVAIITGQVRLRKKLMYSRLLPTPRMLRDTEASSIAGATRMWNAASEPTGTTWRPSTPSCSSASSTPSWGPTLSSPGCTSSWSSWAAWCTPWPTWASCVHLPAPWPTPWLSSPVPPWPCRSSGKQPATCDQPLTPRPPDHRPQATSAARPLATRLFLGQWAPFQGGDRPQSLVTWQPAEREILGPVGLCVFRGVCVHVCPLDSLAKWPVGTVQRSVVKTDRKSFHLNNSIKTTTPSRPSEWEM